tara:strand:- start:8138 stop:10882 length:2745 start_codon:yes stop_codon:yes gene_type:complete
MSKNLDKVQKDLEKIASYYEQLNKDNPFSGQSAQDIASSAKEMAKLEAAVKGAASLVEEMDKSLSSLVKAFESANNEIKSSSAGLTSMNQILSQSSKAAGRVLNHQEGISILSVKQLKKEEEKIKTAQSRLKITRSLLEEEQNALLLKQESGELGTHEQSRLNKIKSALQINNRLIEDKDGLYANTVKHLENEIKAEKRLQSRLGVVGGLLKGISKIPILGDIFDANEAVKEMDAHLRNGGTAVGALFKGFKSVATQIKDGILNPANMIVGLFTLAVDLFKSIDTQTGEFAANMGVTHAEAMGTKEEMMSLAQSTGDSSVRSDILLKSQMAIGKEIGSNAKLNQKDLVTMNKLVNAGKLRMESAAKLEKLSLRTGKSLNKTTKEILGASKAQQMKNGLVLNEMDILDDVANIGDRLALSLGDNPAALAEAAVQARKFGINLQQAEKMARGLLNFEDSIQKEMEAELLTGKSLNLEKARGLALQGKSSEAAAEMLKQVGSSAKFSKMLVPQQEALAASMNMSADEMAKSLRDKEALIKLGGKEGQSAQQRYNEMVAANMSEAEIRKQLGNDEMADMMAKQNIQDKFNDTMFKLKEVLANQLMPVFKQISGFLEKNKDSILSTIKTVGRLVATFMVLKGVISAINILKEAGNAISSGGAIIQNGILATLGLQDSVLAYQMAKAEGMNTLQAFREGMEQNILGKMILQGGRIVYNIGKNAIALGQKAIEVAANGAILSSLTAMGVGIVKNIAKGAIFLVTLLGQAAAALATNAAITFGVGTIVAVGAAYAAYAGIKALTGNDVMSPGKNKPGYGERTLMGPEGAIQLNDKDTVIAGTSLFGNDSVSEPGKSTEMAGKGELKVKSEGLDMSAVIEAINSLAGRPISIQIDGREIAIATEDGNPRAMGENRGANSFQIN